MGDFFQLFPIFSNSSNLSNLSGRKSLNFENNDCSAEQQPYSLNLQGCEGRAELACLRGISVFLESNCIILT